MSITVSMIIFNLLVCIIPALIVVTVCMLRIETIRGDAKSVADKLETMITEYSRIIAQYQAYTDRLSSLSSDVHAVGVRVTGIDEGLTSVNNKLASRERADRLAINRREKEQTEEPAEIPGTKQQVIDFCKLPGVIPLQQQPPVNVIPERQFGEYPAEW